MDSGGTANGGVDLSPAQTFAINVTAVNDAPSFVKGINQRVNPADGAVSVSGWATAISPGPSDESGQALSFIAEADNTDLFDVQPSIAANGKLTFTPKAGAIGTTTVSVRLMDDGGTANGGIDTSVAQQFTISLSPDFEGPVLDAALQNDTAPGTTNFDGVTSDPTIAGSVFDSQGVASLTGAIDNGATSAIAINSDGTFVFVPTIARDGSAEGGHVVHLVALDVFGNETDFDVPFTLDTIAPIAPGLTLSAASGVVASQTSNAARVNLFGNTDPGVIVTLVETGATALADAAGHFEFVSVSLSLGDNVFTTTAVDAAGNLIQTTTTIRRVDSSGQLDPVLLWNQTLLQAIRTDASDPTRASRDMAMVQSAVYDVVNAIEGQTGYYVTLSAPAGTSLEAAIAGAAHEVLAYLFPAQHELFDSVLRTSLSHVPDGAIEIASVNFGRQIGDDNHFIARQRRLGQLCSICSAQCTRALARNGADVCARARSAMGHDAAVGHDVARSVRASWAAIAH